MIRTSRFVTAPAALALVTSTLADAQRPASSAASSINAREVDGHMRFLSHALLEGRAPATHGGQLAAKYIAGQLRAFRVDAPTPPTWNRDTEFRALQSVAP